MRRRLRLKLGLAVAVVSAVAVGAVAIAGTGGSSFNAPLQGYKEVPVISTVGSGKMTAIIDEGAQTITYKLRYSGLESPATQSHIHFGQTDVNGGIFTFLCTNLGNAPNAGVPACPADGGTVEGVIEADDIVGTAGSPFPGASAQGLSAGEFDEAVRAIRAGVTYTNVHTMQFPGGEVRGQNRVSASP